MLNSSESPHLHPGFVLGVAVLSFAILALKLAILPFRKFNPGYADILSMIGGIGQ